MNLFRNLLFWIVLALVGALVAQLLVQDPGKVVVTYGGVNYLTNVPKALLMLIGALLALWLVWKVLSLPFVAMRRHRKKQARARLIDGLDALH
ncbi:heme biosynthesis HemY N-terminal domain-containing protein, partial [Pseudomonas sp. CGJS7]|uniref:heme biosynthesis HemY N-terminal domain-containing protein n=1 Tax=Pseudomonas sp. CGJS7 TaxID=3109348 RepID=UPI00300B6614